jgi:hypothetical protein
MKITHTESYSDKRAAEYPDIGDQLDAIWKFVQTLDVSKTSVEPILDQIQHVKNKYPKTTSNASTSQLLNPNVLKPLV